MAIGIIEFTVQQELQKQSGEQVDVKGEKVLLLGEKAMFWPAGSLLVVSDFHLGKSDHFRKNGIPIPGNMVEQELARVDSLVETYAPAEVLFLGDLFHSIYNKSWEGVVDYIGKRSDTEFSLVEGNHDIMDQSQYERAGLVHHGLVYQKGPFLFAHDHIDDLPDHLYGVYGHIHPGVRLKGRGRQALTLPCFCFREDHLLMPAFGAFTGLAKVKTDSCDRVYVVVDGEVLKV